MCLYCSHRRTPFFCHWKENGPPVGYFMGIHPLKKGNAESIYSAFIGLAQEDECSMLQACWHGLWWYIDVCGEKSGVQALLKKSVPYIIFIYFHYHRLQLKIVQVAISTQGIKLVYSTLTTFWKFFYRSPKRCESFKEVLDVLTSLSWKMRNLLTLGG